MRDTIFRTLMMVFFSPVVWSCGPKNAADESGLDGLEKCSGLFGKKYNDCITQQTNTNSTTENLARVLTASSILQLKSNVGSVMTIKYAGHYRDCKALETGGEAARECNYVDA